MSSSAPPLSTLDIERLVGRIVMLFAESVFYGSFFVLFVVSSLLLNKSRKHLRRKIANAKRRPAWNADGQYEGISQARLKQEQTLIFWLVLGFSLFILLTLHWILIWSQQIAIPANTRPGSRPKGIGATAFLRLFFESTVIVLGDFVVLIRLWTISNRQRVIMAAPIVGLISFVVCSVMALIDQYSHYFRQTPTASATRWWFFGMMLSTLCLNLYSTAFICWKISRAKNNPLETVHDYAMHILSTVIESIALYTIWMLVLLVAILAEPIPMVWSYLLPISPSLYGSALMLVSVRIGLGWAKGPGGSATSSKTGSGSGVMEIVFASAPRNVNEEGSLEMPD